MSCGMKPEWVRWSVYPGRETEETMEANLMFAVRPQNIHPTPKAISILRKMRAVVALPPKKSAPQCLQCDKWIQKKENSAKRQQCFQCSIDKHIESPIALAHWLKNMEACRKSGRVVEETSICCSAIELKRKAQLQSFRR